MVKTQLLPEIINTEILKAAYAEILEVFEDLDRITHDVNGRIRTKLHNCHDNSHVKTFRSKIQIPFFSRVLLVSYVRIRTLKNQNFENQNSQPQKSKIQPQPMFEVFTPDLNYMPFTKQTHTTCHKCGYPNHIETNCTVRTNPFNQNSKKLITHHNFQKPEHAKKVQSQKPDTCNKFSHLHLPEKCAVLPLEGENLSYVRLKISIEIERRALIGTNSCANALAEALFNDLNSTNPKSLPIGKPSFNSVKLSSGQQVPIDRQAKISFQIGPQFFLGSFFKFYRL